MCGRSEGVIRASREADCSCGVTSPALNYLANHRRAVYLVASTPLGLELGACAECLRLSHEITAHIPCKSEYIRGFSSNTPELALGSKRIVTLSTLDSFPPKCSVILPVSKTAIASLRISLAPSTESALLLLTVPEARISEASWPLQTTVYRFFALLSAGLFLIAWVSSSS